MFYATAANRRIASYFNLQKDPGAWRQWLATQGPILAGLDVDSTWDDAAATQGKLDVFHADTVRGGHAICVVGYTKDKRFILRNSWGKTWVDGEFVEALATAPHYAGHAVGSGGTVEFVFRGRKAGNSTISLKQWRHWEGDKSIVGRFCIELAITGGP